MKKGWIREELGEEEVTMIKIYFAKLSKISKNFFKELSKTSKV